MIRDRGHVSGWVRGKPRVCGVYYQRSLPARPAVGSSPRVRGLPGSTPVAPGAAGIIPAHAGFTGSTRSGLQVHGDHPRTRGVYLVASRLEANVDGSSPHTRGLQQEPAPADGGYRIIPAHAGFT